MVGGWQHDVRDGGAPSAEDPPLRPSASKVELDANTRRQEAYAARRRTWTDRWHQPAEPDSGQPAPDQPARPGRGRGGPIHDKRQGRLEL